MTARPSTEPETSGEPRSRGCGGVGSIAVVGVSHRRTRTAGREGVHLTSDQVAEMDRSIAREGAEGVVLATCNRTELYLSGTSIRDARHRAARCFRRLSGGAELHTTAFVYANQQAACHLFRVAGGLDAMVLGDTHVAAQVKQAHRVASEANATGPLLNRLFQAASAASKRIRSETAVSSGSSSVPAAGIAAAERVAGPLSGRRLLVIGAGEIGRLVARDAASRGCGTVVVANRGVTSGRLLADRVGGRAIPLDMLDNEIATADVILSATSAPGFVLTAADHLAAVQRRKGLPLVILDLAVPRDVDPALANAAGVQLIDLDDLPATLGEKGLARRTHVDRAESIAVEEARRYEMWRRSRTATRSIADLRGSAEQMRRSVLARHGAALARLPAIDRGLVEMITSQLVARLLHEPTLELQRAAELRPID